MAGRAFVFWYPLGSVQISEFTDVTDSICGTSDVLGGFNHPLTFCSGLCTNHASL